MEAAAFVLFAFYLDIPFEQKHQFTGDGQSQAESFLSLCIMEPGEFLKDTLLLFLADTASCVTDTEMQLAVSNAARRVMPPSLVNFSALDSRFSAIWRIRNGSPMYTRFNDSLQ